MPKNDMLGLESLTSSSMFSSTLGCFSQKYLKAIASCTIPLHPITGEKTKISLKNRVHKKLHSGTPFPEHNNLSRINFFKMYYFQFQIFLSETGF